MFVQDRTYIETNIRAAAVYKQKLAHFPAKPAKRTAEHHLKHWFSSSSSSSSTPPSNTNYVTVIIVQVCSAAIDQNKSGWKYTPKRHQFFLHKFLLCRFECRCYTLPNFETPSKADTQLAIPLTSQAEFSHHFTGFQVWFAQEKFKFVKSTTAGSAASWWKRPPLQYTSTRQITARSRTPSSERTSQASVSDVRCLEIWMRSD